MFKEEPTEQEANKREMDFKKLLTVTKSKFYMLKINYPEIYNLVNSDVADTTYQPIAAEDSNYDPLAEKKSAFEVKQ